MISKFIRLTGMAACFVLNSPALGQFVEADVEILHEPVGTKSGDNFGANVCAFADYNNDGAMEFLVAAPGVDAGANNAGVVHYFDRATGTIIRSHQGLVANEAAGYVCDAGDVNGDGITDYILAANGDNRNRGAVYVVAGKDHIVPQLADVNHDGQVTPTDFTAWIGNYNTTCCCTLPWLTADFGILQQSIRK